MGQDPGQERAQLTGDPADPAARAAQLQREIEATREDLGDTAAALAAKADVKARAQERADELKTRAQERADELRARAKGAAGEIRQNPAPAVAAGAVAVLAIVWLARRRGRSA